MSKPFITVIMPVYNSEKYLEKAVESVLNQTFGDFELICINDCSKDGSKDILDSLAKKDERVKPIHLPENVGAGKARNFGLDKAEGEYIAFMDADDTVESDMLEKAVNAADGGRADRVLWGMTEKYFSDENELIKTVAVVPERCVCDTPERVLEMSVKMEDKTLFGYLCNSLFKAEIIKEHQLRVNECILYEDFFFDLDFLRYTKVLSIVDSAGYYYLKRSSSITHRFIPQYFDLSYERIRSFYEYCREQNMLTDEMTAIFGNRLLRYTLSALSRNNNPLSGMGKAERREWIKNAIERPLYQELYKKDYPSGKALGVIKGLIKRKNINMLDLAGAFVYKVRG